MKNIAILITTFLRDNYLYRCIKSIRKYYKNIPIYIGDNGYNTDEKQQFCKGWNCTYIELPFDLGVGGTRNEAIKQIPDDIKFLVIVEDDIIFTEGTKLEKWHKILQNDPQIGIVGGLLKIDENKEQHYEGLHRIEDNIKFTDKITSPEWHKIDGIKYFPCDLVLNVFMMRMTMWRGGAAPCPTPIQWDPQFKTALEHSDFFISVKYDLIENHPIRRKKSWKIVYTPDVWMYHKHDLPTAGYQKFRDRKVGFDLFGKKWGLTYSYSDFNAENPIVYGAEPRGTNKPEIFDMLLSSAISVLNELKVIWWLTSGSCLGAIRESNYIKHDADIDIGIAPGQTKLWNKIIDKFKEAGFSLYKDWYYRNYRIELSFIKYGIKLDLFFFYKRGKKCWYGAFSPDKKFIPRSLPAHLFQNLKEIEFRGHKCRVPNPPEEYLKLKYGDDWRRPKKDWKYWLDCKAADNSLFKTDRTIFIAGTWDEIGLGEIELLEAVSKFGGRVNVGVYSDEALAKARCISRLDYKDRRRLIEALKITNRVIRLDDINPGRTFQKKGYIPDCVIIPDGDKEKSYVEYLKIFGSDVYTATEFKEWANEKVNVDKLRPIKADEKRIAIGIKTFLRERNFFRTLKAIQQNFPFSYRLYIADDGDISEKKEGLYQELIEAGHQIIRFPFNSGISIGRNAITRAVKEDYILMMDDDIEINDGESIRQMKTILDARKDVGLVAGVLKLEQGQGLFGNDNYSKGIKFEQKDGLLFRYPENSPIQKIGEISYRIADQAVNFFLARREIFNDVKWDSTIKVEYEHMDFFLELKKTKWKTAICLDAIAIHLHPELNDFEYDRYRRSAPFSYFSQKHGIAKIINRWH